MSITQTPLTPQVDATDSTSYSFNVVVGSNCTLVVPVTGRSSGVFRDIISVTFDGVERLSVATSGWANAAAIAVGDVTAGTISVVVTFSLGVARCGITPYTMTGHASNTPVATTTIGNTTGTSGTFTLNFPSGGGSAIYAVMHANGDTTWPAASEDNDIVVETVVRMSSARKTASGSGNTESPTWTSGSFGGVAAVWEPTGSGGSASRLLLSHAAYFGSQR